MPAVADVEGETVRLVVELQVSFVGGGAVHAAGLFAVFVQSEAGADEGVCAVTDGEFGLDAVANGARQGAAVCAGMVEGLGLGAVVAGRLRVGVGVYLGCGGLSSLVGGMSASLAAWTPVVTRRVARARVFMGCAPLAVAVPLRCLAGCRREQGAGLRCG